jgi:hypothetical protein
LALNSGMPTYQTLTNDDEVCIPSLSSILIAVPGHLLSHCFNTCKKRKKIFAISHLGIQNRNKLSILCFWTAIVTMPHKLLTH